jgi:hypothetical protein
MNNFKKIFEMTNLEKCKSGEFQQLIQGLQGQFKKDIPNKTLWTQEFAATGKIGKR